MPRGSLRVYLGAAPGVGKTYAMLGEGHRRRERGTDVVVAYVETHGRAKTAEQLGNLEVVARKVVTHRGSRFEEMDVDAVITRAPKVALVDELAHTNVPGSRNEKRWQDVHELLEAGIDVITTVNVQHLESMNDVVEEITGILQHETVPDHVVRAADQIELVDMAPEALQRRMVHGNIYGPEKVDAALTNYFRAGNLSALRELALLWVADRVDEALIQYREKHEISGHWETRERVVVAVTGAPSGENLIRRAGRIAQRSHGELLGVHIRADDARTSGPSTRLDEHRQLLEDLGGVYHELVSNDIVGALVDFAAAENSTQIVLGASQRSRLVELTRGSVINEVIRRSAHVDVHVISTDSDMDEAADARPRAGRRRSEPLPVRRRAAAWVLAVVGPAMLTAVLANSRGAFGQASQYLLFQILVLACASVGGIGPALLGAVLGALSLNWYFTEPLYTWTVDDAENVVALVAFTITGVAVGLLVTGLARRSNDARRLRREADALARIAAGLVASDDPLPSMLDRARTLLGLDALAVEAEGRSIASVGEAGHRDARRIALANGGLLVVVGELGPDAERLLSTFANQVSAALERRRMEAEIADAQVLAEADRFRTAVLRAVSHDLRTPLASVKAAVTSLEQDDVQWTAAERAEFLGTIHEETDRLDTLVANLLDASRLEAGVLQPRLQPVALEDVVAAAIGSLSRIDRSRLDVDIDPTLPEANADAGLLERVVANLLSNAARVVGRNATVQVRAAATPPDLVTLSIIDHGPGVPEQDRPRMFQPFQRLGDNEASTGIGLGLSVARGLVEAMGGSLVPATTPGGGLTMTIQLRTGRDG